jgi:hypothetical protein
VQPWQRGRATIERLLGTRELEQVQPSPVTATRLIESAAAHLRLAEKGVDDDPDGAFQLGYDAARKACTALLAVQGLRATSHGGHVAVQEAIREQFGGTGGMPVFGQLSRLRRLRNATEYPDPDSPTITADDATECLQTATEIHDACRRILDSARLGPWT